MKRKLPECSCNSANECKQFCGSINMLLPKIVREKEKIVKIDTFNPRKVNAVERCFREIHRWNSAVRSKFWLWKYKFLILIKADSEMFRELQVKIEQHWIRTGTAVFSAHNFWIRLNKLSTPLKPQPRAAMVQDLSGTKHCWDCP